ncbi:hypothetical protein GN956_G3251 [Arapaima gigas]
MGLNSAIMGHFSEVNPFAGLAKPTSGRPPGVSATPVCTDKENQSSIFHQCPAPVPPLVSPLQNSEMSLPLGFLLFCLEQKRWDCACDFSFF